MKYVAILVLASSLPTIAATSVAAQGGATSSIAGVVKDDGGGVLPGASVVVASNATGTKSGAITNSTGTYSIPTELRADVLDVFDNVNFSVLDANRTPGSGGTIFQTTEAYRDLDNTYDPGGRLGQLAIRFNW